MFYKIEKEENEREKEKLIELFQKPPAITGEMTKIRYLQSIDQHEKI